MARKQKLRNPKGREGIKVSLAPLTPEQALADLLQVRPPKKDNEGASEEKEKDGD